MKLIMNVIQKIIKWSVILSIFGSGWLAFSILLFLEDTPNSTVISGLPLEEIENGEFWDAVSLEAFPTILRDKGEIIAVSKYGFADIQTQGLLKLNTEQARVFAQNYLNDSEREVENDMWEESILCTGKGDLAFGWKINNNRRSVRDLFEFCFNVFNESSTTVQRFELIKNQPDGYGYSYFEVDYYVGTGFFVISHGRS